MSKYELKSVESATRTFTVQSSQPYDDDDESKIYTDVFYAHYLPNYDNDFDFAELYVGPFGHGLSITSAGELDAYIAVLEQAKAANLFP